MGQSPQFAEPFARDLIAQCRREIAAAWEQVEAGRRILASSRWLFQRWAEQARRANQAGAFLRSVAPRPSMAGTFELVEETETPRERLKRRASMRSRFRAASIAAGRQFHSPAFP